MLRREPLVLLSVLLAAAAQPVHHHQHVQQHPHGPEAVTWLADAELVFPHLGQRAWHDNLILAYAAGYSFDTLKPFVYSCISHVPDAELVLLTPAERIEGLPPDLSPRSAICVAYNTCISLAFFARIPSWRGGGCIVLVINIA